VKIIIHTRHADLASDFKVIAEEKLRSMERFSVAIDRIEVEITHEANPRQGKNSHRVVITSHGSGPLLRAMHADLMMWLPLTQRLRILSYKLDEFMKKRKVMDEKRYVL
jgi:ribosome-associated translation inhibitor RaiA